MVDGFTFELSDSQPSIVAKWLFALQLDSIEMENGKMIAR